MKCPLMALAVVPLIPALVACNTVPDSTNLRSERAELTMLLHGQVQRCYVVPIASRGAPSATIEVRLKPDGSLAQGPVALDGNPNSPVTQAALRALRRCTPFKIPAVFAPQYPFWKTLRIVFSS
ncbi:hypothetical protein K9B37_00645 [Microvirga sp. WGZ8]|uniref:Cell envelope integrity protein TolA n=1 Tax=Microvirga puerhi TaxID=2876078 RepID=A0ABS7VH31_9HYPH|nr:hypothetical protein [Microvirga puerhi]